MRLTQGLVKISFLYSCNNNEYLSASLLIINNYKSAAHMHSNTLGPRLSVSLCLSVMFGFECWESSACIHFFSSDLHGFSVELCAPADANSALYI